MNFIKNLGDKIARISAITLVAGIMTLGLAACGGAASDSTSPTATPAAQTGGATGASDTGNAAASASATPAEGASASSGDVQQIDAKLVEWAVNLSTSEVNAGKVRFNVTNGGQFTHDLGVLDASGNEVGVTPKFKAADGAQTLELDLKPGTYSIVCDITGHTDKGMKTQLTVK